MTWALKEWIASEQSRVVHVSCDAGFSDLGVERVDRVYTSGSLQAISMLLCATSCLVALDEEEWGA